MYSMIFYNIWHSHLYTSCQYMIYILISSPSHWWHAWLLAATQCCDRSFFIWTGRNREGTIPCRTIPNHTAPYCTMSYHTRPYHTMLHPATPYPTTPHHTVAYSALYHTAPQCTIMHHTAPYHNIPHHTSPYSTSISGSALPSCWLAMVTCATITHWVQFSLLQCNSACSLECYALDLNAVLQHTVMPTIRLSGVAHISLAMYFCIGM